MSNPKKNNEKENKNQMVEENNKGRKPLDLTEIREIPIIKEHLTDFEESNPKRYQRYLRDLQKVYPAIIEKYGTFEAFLAEDANKKSVFLQKWADSQADDKAKLEKNGNKKEQSLKNSALRIIWMVQGFLGKLGSKYKANHENIELIQNETNLDLPITMDDITQLYDVLPPKLRLILKVMTFTGLNPADIVILTLNDFKLANGSGYYYIYKLREKTKYKNGKYICIFHKEFYEELVQFAKGQNIKPNEPLFNMLPNTLLTQFTNYIAKYNLNPKIIPKYIRQLCFTEIDSVLPNRLVDIWSQHKLKGVVDQNYIKRTIDEFAKYYPLICQKVLIRSTYEYQKIKIESDDQKAVNQQVSKVLQTMLTTIMKNPPKNENTPQMANGNEPLITDQSLQTLKEELEKLQKLLQK